MQSRGLFSDPIFGPLIERLSRSVDIDVVGPSLVPATKIALHIKHVFDLNEPEHRSAFNDGPLRAIGEIFRAKLGPMSQLVESRRVIMAILRQPLQAPEAVEALIRALDDRRNNLSSTEILEFSEHEIRITIQEIMNVNGYLSTNDFEKIFSTYLRVKFTIERLSMERASKIAEFILQIRDGKIDSPNS